MSRRHRETETKENYKPQQAESQEDGSLREKRSFLRSASSLLKFSVVKRDGSKDGFSLSKIVTAICKAFSKEEIEVDDKWVKIPRSAFDEQDNALLSKILKRSEPQPEEKSKSSKRGANPIKRIFNKIADSKVMEFFHDAINNVKAKCVELYEGLTQFAICFLHGSHKAFAPDEDPYRKLSHFYKMVKSEFRDIPTRKTFNNYKNWFVNWRPVLYNESPKEKNERKRHSLWRRLIEWISHYLIEIAPEYAVQPLGG